MKKIREWFSLQISKNPGRMVLLTILIFNILFFFFSAVIISNLSLDGTESMGILEAAFCTLTMILDPGCIQFVIADIGTAGVTVVLVCLAVVLIGMISFTGAVIGYITNYISHFIDNANQGNRRLNISGHAVILNWNTRASEIINDLLYCRGKQKVVVLTGSGKADIEKEIEERIADTIARENQALRKSAAEMNQIKRFFYVRKYRFRRNVTVIVREGDVFSSKQLHDISLEHARMTIILGNDVNNTICKFEHKEMLDDAARGNAQTVKTLMQVSDITGADYSDDNQKIIVEITDPWTQELVDRIIQAKQVNGKCNIVPVNVNQILGHILSQFSLMPELNYAYRELFSNKGSAFYTKEGSCEREIDYIRFYMRDHKHAIPLTFMSSDGKSYGYYSAASEEDVDRVTPILRSDYSVSINRDYWIERKKHYYSRSQQPLP